jgi:hypothetical protein
VSPLRGTHGMKSKIIGSVLPPIGTVYDESAEAIVQLLDTTLTSNGLMLA